MNKVIYVLLMSLISNEGYADGVCRDHPELAFFNKLGGNLEIQLSEPTEPVSDRLANHKATASATLKSLVMNGQYYDDDAGFRDLASLELEQIAYNESTITLSGAAMEPVKHKAPNGEFFTVKDLLKAVELTELKTRHKTEWFGGINVHHVYFEGIGCEDGAWLIYWGS